MDDARIITDLQTICSILTDTVKMLISNGKADSEGFVDCMDIGSEIKNSGYSLPKRKISEYIADFPEAFESKLIKKGAGFVRMIRLVHLDQDENNYSKQDLEPDSNHEEDTMDSISSIDYIMLSDGTKLTKNDLAEAYNKLTKWPPLGYYDFTDFIRTLNEQKNIQIDAEEFKEILINRFPTVSFFNKPYESRTKDGETKIILCAFRIPNLKTDVSTSSTSKLIQGLNKELLRKVYISLEPLSKQFRDFELFCQILSEKLNRIITQEELKADLKTRFGPEGVKFWKNMTYEVDGKIKRVKTAFYSRNLSKKKNALSLLNDFAFFPPINNKEGIQVAIEQLAKKALPEKWHYGNDKDNNGTHPILKNYLVYTFQRLLSEDEKNKTNPSWKPKIRINAEGKQALFNTGLVDTIYEPIYALFECNRRSNAQPWVFKAFVGSRDALMQTITRSFGTELPEPAHYYNDTSELVYNIKSGIGSTNWDHILNRCDRFPLEFWEENIPKFDFNRPKTPEFYQQLSQYIRKEHRLLKRIKDRIDDAVDYALKRVRWNFKTAIPIYYPGQQKISLLLPLSLLDETQIDVALVLEATDNGAYIAHTILSLQMAYMNARLITRPDSDWLTAETILVKKGYIDEFED